MTPLVIRIFTLPALLAIQLLITPDDRQPVRALITELWETGN